MANQSEIPDVRIDPNSLYREEILTDRKAGTIRRLIPIKLDGSRDTTRVVLFSGQTQLLTPAGVLPLAFEIEGTTLEDALKKFPDAMKRALDEAIEEAREFRREAASRIVVPEAGAGALGRRPGRGRRVRRVLIRRRGISRYCALLGEPRAEIDQLAALAAKRPVRVIARPLDRPTAGRALDAGGAHDETYRFGGPSRGMIQRSGVARTALTCTCSA